MMYEVDEMIQTGQLCKKCLLIMNDGYEGCARLCEQCKLEYEQNSSTREAASANLAKPLLRRVK